MNSLLLVGICLVACALVAMAGPPINKGSGHRVVFEFVSADPQQQEALLNSVDDVLQGLGNNTQVMVVVHGAGLNLLHRAERALADRMTALAAKRVAFVVCGNTMRRQNLQKESLLPVAVIVDSGVAEVVRRQEDGWSYIKSGH
jgi:uncharacterized protein